MPANKTSSNGSSQPKTGKNQKRSSSVSASSGKKSPSSGGASSQNRSASASQAAKKREAAKREEIRKKQLRNSRIKEISLILIIGICVLLFISCFAAPLSWLGDFSYSVFGIMRYVMPFVIIGLTILFMYSSVNWRLIRKVIAGFICLFALQGILSVALKEPDGGLLGKANYALFYKGLGSIGMYVVDVIILAVGIVLFTDYSLMDLFTKRTAKDPRDEAARAEAYEERRQVREEQRALKRRNAELEREARHQEEMNRLKTQNQELSQRIEDNERRLKDNRGRFTPIVGIGDTKIFDSDPEPETTVYRPEETVIARPTDARKESAAKNEEQSKAASKYSNSGSVVSQDAELKNISPDSFPEVHVPNDYFRNDEEEIFVKPKSVAREDEMFAELNRRPEEKKENARTEDEYVRKVLTAPEHEEKRVQETVSHEVNKKMRSDPAEDKKTAEEIEKAITKKPEKDYVIPPLSLLSRGPSGAQSKAELQAELRDNAAKLQQTLKTFGVDVTITNISCGPAVTRYEIQPAQGVKVSRIVSLTDDIKLNLAAADIRMEAPIPGKSAIGIEIPNKVKQSVYLRDLLETDEFKKHRSMLSFGAGRDIDGSTIIADISRMPHVLVAGATGSGKSVCINAIIMSILYHAKPTEVKMIMVDPKVVELSVYNGIPHLLLPVVTDPKKAASALNWAVAEMENRYQLFAEFGVRNYEGFNQMIDAEGPVDENGEPLQKMAQLLIIVDELADLMMVAANDVETAIARLAQKARAAGIHLVLATQRPSVDVITGLIKANIPSRIAFAVSSGVDSRTILDMNGAEKLLGMGDMLYAPAGASKPIRVQGSFVSDADVKKVVDYIIEQGPVKGGSSSAKVDLNQTISSGGGASSSERDEYFADAGRLVIEKEKASIGMLQRAFKLGFNRAARIVDQLAEAGVVGEEEGTKPRRVLMKPDEFEAYLQEHQE